MVEIPENALGRLKEIKMIRKRCEEFSEPDGVFLKTQNQTPAHTFVQLTCELDAHRLITTMARDSYREQAALWLLRRARSMLTELKHPPKRILCDDNIYPGHGREELGRFDRLVVLPPTYWRNFKGESPMLEECTWMVQPTFGIELDGDLTVEQFQHRIGRKDGWRIDLLNWNRLIEIR
jgi:hypothetical protein